ncbi:MAG: hypothetical protein ABIH20_01520 [Candidatus Diapherotrites archaeon]
MVRILRGLWRKIRDPLSMRIRPIRGDTPASLKPLSSFKKVPAPKGDVRFTTRENTELFSTSKSPIHVKGAKIRPAKKKQQ